MSTAVAELDGWRRHRWKWTLAQFKDRLREVEETLAEESVKENVAERLSREKPRLEKVLDLAKDRRLKDADAVLPRILPKTEYSASVRQARERGDQLRQQEAGHKRRACLNCREIGHDFKDCSRLKEEKKTCCWRCGKADHSIIECPEPEDDENPMPFAICFLCREKGHVLSKCPLNPNGIYPKGGSCFRCGSIYHLATKCPMRSEKIEEKRENRKRRREDKSATSQKVTGTTKQDGTGERKQKAADAGTQYVSATGETDGKLARPQGTRAGKQVQKLRSMGLDPRKHRKQFCGGDRPSGPRRFSDGIKYGNSKRTGRPRVDNGLQHNRGVRRKSDRTQSEE